MTEKVVLESVRLLAVDDKSKEIVERLKVDGIGCMENNSNFLLNVVITTSKKGIDEARILLSCQTVTCKTVLLRTSDMYEAAENDDFDAVLSFPIDNNMYEDIKSFLYVVYYSIEIHGIYSFDFYDFFSLIKGRNIISLQTYPYTSAIDEALSLLKYDRSKINNKYLLTLCVGHNETDYMKQLREVGDHSFIETFPDDMVLDFNIIESVLKQVILLKITPNS